MSNAQSANQFIRSPNFSEFGLMKNFWLVILILLISFRVSAQSSIYWNDSTDVIKGNLECKFIKEKNNGEHIFTVTHVLDGKKRYTIHEKYDSSGRLIYLKLNLTKRVDALDTKKLFTWDEQSRIKSVSYSSKDGLLIPYRYKWKVEFDYVEMTVKTYHYKKGKFIYDGKYRLNENPTIRKLMVWSYKRID